MDWLTNNIANRLINVKSYSACQTHCQEDLNCEFFVWIDQDHGLYGDPNQVFECYLKWGKVGNDPHDELVWSAFPSVHSNFKKCLTNSEIVKLLPPM